MVFRGDPSPTDSGPDLDRWIMAAAKEVAQPLRCRFLVTQSANNMQRVKRPDDPSDDYTAFAVHLIMCDTWVREAICFPSMTRRRSSKWPRSGTWAEDDISNSPSTGNEASDVVAVLRFTRDESYFTLSDFGRSLEPSTSGPRSRSPRSTRTTLRGRLPCQRQVCMGRPLGHVPSSLPGRGNSVPASIQTWRMRPPRGS